MVTIYTNFVELESSMLHAKLHDYGISGSREEEFKIFFIIYGHDGHLGHLTKMLFTKFMSPLPKKAPHKIWL